MRRQHDSSLVESALRRNLVRPLAPVGFTEHVMAGIRDEGLHEPFKPKRAWRFSKPSFRMACALTCCACAAMLLFTLGLPTGREDRKAEQVALHGTERELAEVLQLAGNKWNQAREAAFSPRLDNDND